MNVVVIRGRLSSTPVLRSLTSGSTLLSLEVTTTTQAGTASVPVAWFDPPSVPEWASGDELVVVGVVKRRFYRGPGGTQTRTEVVASDVVEGAKRRQVQRVIAQCVATLTAGSTDIGLAPARTAARTRRETST